MTRADVVLLSQLQANSNRSIADLASVANMSTSACHRRIRLLEERGLITGYAARLDPAGLRLGIHGFIEISLVSQSEQMMAAFESAVRAHDDILECHLMSGSADYLLRIAAIDIAHFDRLHRMCLSKLPGVSSMRTSFSIRNIKAWQGYPLTHLSGGTHQEDEGIAAI